MLKNNKGFLAALIVNKHDNKIINLLDCVEKLVEDLELFKKYPQLYQEYNKFKEIDLTKEYFEKVSNYNKLKEISDLTKEYFDYEDLIYNICNGKVDLENIDELKNIIKEAEDSSNKRRIKTILSEYFYSFNTKNRQTIEDFLSSHKEILNSFFYKDFKKERYFSISHNEEIIKYIKLLSRKGYVLDNIFKDIKDDFSSIEILKSRIYEEIKKYLKKERIEEICKEYSNLKDNKIVKNFLSAHEEILNSFFDKDDIEYISIEKNQNILLYIDLLVYKGCDVTVIFKDVNSIEDLNLKIKSDYRNIVNEVQIEKIYKKFSNPKDQTKIKDFLLSHEKILDIFFTEIDEEKHYTIEEFIEVVKNGFNLYDVFKDAKSKEDFSNKLSLEIKRLKISTIYASHPNLKDNQKIKDFLSSHEKILDDFFSTITGKRGINKVSEILEKITQLVIIDYNLDNIIKAEDNLQDLKRKLDSEKEEDIEEHRFQWIFQTSKLNIPDKIKDEIKNKIKEIEKYDIQVFNSLLTHMDSVNKEAFSEEIKQAIKEKMINIFLMLKDLKMRYSNDEASNIEYIASENHYLVFRILLKEYFNSKIT